MYVLAMKSPKNMAVHISLQGALFESKPRTGGRGRAAQRRCNVKADTILRATHRRFTKSGFFWSGEANNFFLRVKAI